MPNLNIVICPGCGSQVPLDNRGCSDCGYENNDDGRLLTIAEIVARPSYPAPGAMRLNDVSPAFLKAVVTAARVGALQDAATMARSVSNIAEAELLELLTPLPEEIREQVEEWGLADTDVHEQIYAHLRAQQSTAK